MRPALERIEAEVGRCRACDRLVAWREEAARVKRAAFRSEEYWGRGVAGFGDPEARLLILGLAPAAHGANRTGRVFTGDRSGDWLYASLHRTGFASQASSRHRGDGLRLEDVWVTAAVKCAPPANRPLPDERKRCAHFLDREVSALGRLELCVALGGFAWDAALRLARGLGAAVPVPAPRFGHLAEARLPGAFTLIGSYHPSQQNTFTGVLTEKMLDAVFLRAAALLAYYREHQ